MQAMIMVGKKDERLKKRLKGVVIRDIVLSGYIFEYPKTAPDGCGFWV